MRQTLLWAAALALLGLSELATPMNAPPLYDGVGLGNEPYRYVRRPPGHPVTPPPSGTSATIPITHGVVGPGMMSTLEMYPQASISTSNGAFVTPRGATSATLAIAPVKPPVTPPSGYVLDGNLYRFTATANGFPLRIARGADIRIALRGTGKKGTASVALFSASHWDVLSAPPTGVPATYSAQLQSLGDATLVVPASEAFAKPGPTPLISARVIVILATLGVLAGILLLIRLGRRDGEAA